MEKPNRIVGDENLPLLFSFDAPFRDKKSKKELLTRYIFSEIEQFKDEFVDDTNWHKFMSYCYTKALTNSDFQELEDLVKNLSRTELIVGKKQFHDSIKEACQYLLHNLPKVIERGFCQSQPILDELKDRKTPRYKDFEKERRAPSYLQDDEFEYNYMGTWLEQIIQREFYNPFKDIIQDKLRELESWEKENYQDEYLPNSLSNRNIGHIVSSKLIRVASKTFKIDDTRVSWKEVVHFLNALYYSELTDCKIKKFLKDECLIRHKDSTEAEYLSLIDKVRKRGQPN